MGFFTSDIAVAIAWVCGVAGFIYAIVQKNEANRLRVQLQNSQALVQSLNNSAAQTDASRNDVEQHGKKNVYTKNNSGGIKINM